MSAEEPWATEASFSPFDGSSVSKYCPVAGACHVPLMKCPKRWLWRCSHACASFGSSGAGPYSIDTNFSAILMQVGSILSSYRNHIWQLRNWMTILRRIASGRIVFKLPLDISQQPTCTKSKKLRPHPRLPQFFFHHGQPVGRLFCRTNAAGRLETHSHSRLLGVFADGASHYQTHGQRGIGGFFAG